ncbi:hypothetical protein TraAM80_00464 [Trypanosoma rangeli]|uniref:Uncharacterized protein n=1 Tax=Trypanosoma rangeli TaxID=5698 RepID=A0A3R7RSU6_TRYRA|nr:uncharacterized protein TraAM80_00464 [Trypanosoma rangeli]RNF12183.1 hypothetical protein TraAM80_00464 [Trypanosoma rangeli]|eukprot:RNF12183.1 hypothetical protein TraAM80_00464 [Trypanosoma rangeli]
MPMGNEDQTLSARLCSLPATEHAILLNRFKFLDLVQRVAAADVAEMVQTIGLEALSYKGTLEKISPLCVAAADVKRPTPLERPTRRGALPPQRGHTRDANVSTESASRQRHRFYTRDEELHFVKRLSQPQKNRDPLDFQLRKPPRGQQEEGIRYTRGKSSSPQFSGGYDMVAAGESRHGKNSGRRHGYTDNDYNDDDDVVIASSDDRWALTGDPLKVRFITHMPIKEDRPLPILTQHQPLEQPAREPSFREVSPDNHRRGISSGPEGRSRTAEGQGTTNDNGGDRTQNESEAKSKMELKQQEQPTDASHSPLMEIATPRTMQSSVTRYRGHFAPKAKPKAAAEVPRVPMEVIRHASALLMGRNVAPAPAHPPNSSAGPQEPQQPPPASTHSVSWDTQSPKFPSGTSQSLMQNSSVRRGVRKGELEAQTGQTPILETTKALSDEALAELTSAVERMLQDHRAVLDGILKDKGNSSSEVATPTDNKKKGGHEVYTGVTGDNVGGRASKMGGKRGRLSATPTTEESARIVQQAHDALEDLDDEEDELLLVSRIQRHVGAMDRELGIIEQREQQQYGLSGEGKEGLEDDKSERSLRPRESLKHDGRRVVNDDFNRAVPGGVADRGRRRCRRCGEIPRAIVERLRSFQKENHEYIRYTEKQWNTSHVTEQTFAQRLTETLAEDAFQEVFQEVGSILDTYVEGLVLHELQ